jgi:peptidoglycan-N-acetylglucosamine deacetylase
VNKGDYMLEHYNYSYSTRRRGFPFFRMLVIILIVIYLGGLAYMQTQNSKISDENSILQSEIDNIKIQNEKLLSEKEQLSSTIKEKEQQYLEAVKDLKVAYLTFDDGPSKNTEEILKILDEYNVKATFFVIHNEYYKEYYKKILDAGHTIALHSYSHDYSDIYRSIDTFKMDIEKLKDFITATTGKTPENILRYPGGSDNTVSRKYGGRDIMTKIVKAMTEENYAQFDWNVDSTDASNRNVSKDTIVNNVLKYAKNKNHADILMHDANVKVTTVQALPEIIEGLKAQGFIFDVLTTDESLEKLRVNSR